MDPVPVAERLLQTKLFGVPVRRLAQAVALPLAPALLASLIGLGIPIVGPLLAVGVAIGAVLFYRTPPGQSPFTWVGGAIGWILGPDRTYWHPVRHESGPSVLLDRLRTTDERRTRSHERPAPPSGPLGGERTTAGKLDFDHVRDDGIVVRDDGYARILELGATPWLILDESGRESTIQAFERYLSGVGASIQFLSLPVPFDVDPHRSAVRTGGGSRDSESRILRAGRDRHAEWLQQVVRDGNVRDRRHFAVVSIDAESATVDQGGVPSGTGASGIDAVAEVNARARNASSSLPRTGVSATVLEDRDAVLEVLYRYYRGTPAPAEMDHGWLTRRGGEEQT